MAEDNVAYSAWIVDIENGYVHLRDVLAEDSDNAVPAAAVRKQSWEKSIYSCYTNLRCLWLQHCCHLYGKIVYNRRWCNFSEEHIVLWKLISMVWPDRGY
jgi:hypothetical protein